VINLAASEETAAVVREILKPWMDLGISRERMEDIVARLED